jgi:heterodisulfide reductase subunit C
MTGYFELFSKDVRFREGLTACMNCGVCTAICPAAEFYKYDPRQICNLVQSRDDEKIEEILKSETIWYCGQCMSCKTRCPRGNVPALIISVLRKVSQEQGFFVESEKGRQQFAIKRTVGDNILKTGYCVHVDHVNPKMHPEQGPIWKWFTDNAEEVADRLGANYNKEGGGALRKISKENLDEVRKIFDVTGGNQLFNHIENYSKEKAGQLKLGFENTDSNNEYFFHTYIDNSNNHQK